MPKKQKTYSHPPWKYCPQNEKNGKKPKFVQVYHTQLTHEKFLKLSSIAKLVYIYMLDYSNGYEHTVFPRRMYKNITTPSTFSRAIKELEKNGFIMISHAKFQGTENMYQFSSEWWK